MDAILLTVDSSDILAQLNLSLDTRLKEMYSFKIVAFQSFFFFLAHHVIISLTKANVPYGIRQIPTFWCSMEVSIRFESFCFLWKIDRIDRSEIITWWALHSGAIWGPKLKKATTKV